MPRWTRSSARILPMGRETLAQAADYRRALDLGPQDALVYASVVADLGRRTPERSCFVTRNPKDFDNEDLKAELAVLHCKPLFTFRAGLHYVQGRS